MLVSRAFEVIYPLQREAQTVAQPLDLALVFSRLQLDHPLADIIDLGVHPLDLTREGADSVGQSPQRMNLGHADRLRFSHRSHDLVACGHAGSYAMGSR
ncbi:hypothetical protein D3C85_1595880 [compost metagenome]